MNPLRWNARQGLVVLCGALLLAGLLSYPPWRVTRHHAQNMFSGGLWHFAGYAGSTTELVGYAPLFRPPHHSTWEVEDPHHPATLFGPHRYRALGFESVYTIEWPLLILPIVVVCLVCIVAIDKLRGRPVKAVDLQPDSGQNAQSERGV